MERRIARLESLLSDVALRRTHAESVAPRTPCSETAVAGWNHLDREFRTALGALWSQRDIAEPDL